MPTYNADNRDTSTIDQAVRIADLPNLIGEGDGGIVRILLSESGRATTFARLKHDPAKREDILFALGQPGEDGNVVYSPEEAREVISKHIEDDSALCNTTLLYLKHPDILTPFDRVYVALQLLPDGGSLAQLGAWTGTSKQILSNHLRFLGLSWMVSARRRSTTGRMQRIQSRDHPCLVYLNQREFFTFESNLPARYVNDSSSLGQKYDPALRDRIEKAVAGNQSLLHFLRQDEALVHAVRAYPGECPNKPDQKSFEFYYGVLKMLLCGADRIDIRDTFDTNSGTVQNIINYAGIKDLVPERQKQRQELQAAYNKRIFFSQG